MSDFPNQTATAEALDQAVAQGGAYEVLGKRLKDQGHRLTAAAQWLNKQRLAEFGETQMTVLGRVRIRTEHNCIARDIVRVGDWLLFGYNVFIGLKKKTAVADVFSLYKLNDAEGGYEAEPVSLRGTFLTAPEFIRDFTELHTFYSNTKLLQLAVRDEKLLASFQVGDKLSDIRVFRWSIAKGGTELSYIDSRGERDMALPAQFDFEWSKSTQDRVVTGKHGHINILDTVFVETIGGDLTIKIENNTQTGEGIYSEPVKDPNQSLSDGHFEFARLGSLLILKVLPYRETEWRYIVFNTITRTALRIDAIGQACRQLPEDHGIIFPGGYYLQNGDHKTFDQDMLGMRFKRVVRSPNGEDVQYSFYEPASGRSALLTYNMITRQLQIPLLGHGYARLEDGRTVIFCAEGNEPTRIHPMVVWSTPFYTAEFAAHQAPRDGFIGKIGNAELVRGISDLHELVRDIDTQSVSVQRYSKLCESTRKVLDAYHWLDAAEAGGLGALLHELASTSEQILDEFEKVQSIRGHSEKALGNARNQQRKLLVRVRAGGWQTAQDYVDALNDITRQRGQLLTIRDLRYIDTEQVDALQQQLLAVHEQVGASTVAFLGSEAALSPFNAELDEWDAQALAATTVAQLRQPLDGLAKMAAALDMLSKLMASLPIDDATKRTEIVDAICEVYARLNQAKARAEQRRKGLGSAEAVAQFGAQFKLFGQAITNALQLAADPERCDEELSRLSVQLEELESQFGEHEAFLTSILEKRQDMVDTFEAHRQSLLDDRQRRAQAVVDAAARILESLPQRVSRLSNMDELNAFFAADPLILKLRDMAARLRGVKDSVRADDVEAQLKGARDQAVRSLRDKTELFDEGGNVIKLGPRHRFSVNTQALDLTLMPRGDAMYLHLTGTDFMEPIDNDELAALRPFWNARLASESPALYRGEYLAGLVLDAAVAGRGGTTLERLTAMAQSPSELAKHIRDFCAPRYKEGYQKGIHDHDAALILAQLLPLRSAAGLLRYSADARAIALLCWEAVIKSAPQAAKQWCDRARSARQLRSVFGSCESFAGVQSSIGEWILDFLTEAGAPQGAFEQKQAAEYLVETLSSTDQALTFSRYAKHLMDALQSRLEAAGAYQGYLDTLGALEGDIGAAWSIAIDWFHGLVANDPTLTAYQAFVREAAAISLLPVERRLFSDAAYSAEVSGLLGEHERIVEGRLRLAADDFGTRFARHSTEYLPRLQHYQALRQRLLRQERASLRLSEFRARPLSSFVRNKLINDVYLSVIGDNLAKQMGTVGEGKRTDLMGMLMLISPPGYGKTTLMEYVANRLGLVFMKVNGPALGHQVRSLDPAKAPDATSRQELEKLNLALVMGNNVMLYMDDIQHTHPEFLQKFISLCDGTRRIEGVWKAETKTYDMRGKKFCVVMAGNPYTETGEVFKIPDMLANRADIYNLGDTLGGMEEAFALSYIENALTSNPVLAPLATRDMNDLYRFIDKVQGKPFTANDLSHTYSAAQLNEISDVLERLVKVRDVVTVVNRQYIDSAAQADTYRSEPAFRLQGSYRNMNKMAEKVSAVMNNAELMQLVADHYQGEAQLLSTGAEENLLKLAELRGLLCADQTARWEQIKRDFQRNKAMGGGQEVGARVVAQLNDIAESMKCLALR
ncbi:DNA repair ATPase [Pseudomonas typographi]|uniref:DNA repair ATPase n=1 Tax=Pseudomonas typographi TaxID=2715964 RepID=UPI001681DCAF|nr:DNA repair ATPase [Pseudomonas typographi]MBD1585186.1 AAA family ATPase [Pseudomonas typographi]